MQMIHVMNGIVNKKSMHYFIYPHQTVKQFSEMLLKMGDEITEKLVGDLRNNFLQ